MEPFSSSGGFLQTLIKVGLKRLLQLIIIPPNTVYFLIFSGVLPIWFSVSFSICTSPSVNSSLGFIWSVSLGCCWSVLLVGVIHWHHVQNDMKKVTSSSIESQITQTHFCMTIPCTVSEGATRLTMWRLYRTHTIRFHLHNSRQKIPGALKETAYIFIWLCTYKADTGILRFTYVQDQGSVFSDRALSLFFV